MTASRPLEGVLVVVTRPAARARPLGEALEEKGADVLYLPTIEVAAPRDGGAALREALSRLAGFEWVSFTSQYAVSSVAEALGELSALSETKVAAVGRPTAQALSSRGVSVDWISPGESALDLARSLPPPSGPRAPLLWPKGSRARDELKVGLEDRGYAVEAVEAYRVVEAARNEEAAGRLGEAGAVVFASAFTAGAFLAAYGREALPPVVCSIGPVTTRGLATAGVAVHVEAAESSAVGIAEALGLHFSQNPRT